MQQNQRNVMILCQMEERRFSWLNRLFGRGRGHLERHVRWIVVVGDIVPRIKHIPELPKVITARNKA